MLLCIFLCGIEKDETGGDQRTGSGVDENTDFLVKKRLFYAEGKSHLGFSLQHNW